MSALASPPDPRRLPVGPMVAAMVAAASAAILVYARVIRPWHLRWGASAAEVERPLPGDALVKHPTLAATRAITIRAHPDEVWPWLVQMGYRRAGWYSYDRFDNDGIHVNRILPELQTLGVGDMMLTGAEGGFRVEAIDPGRSLAMKIDGARMGVDADISAALVLEPLDTGRTRLILRVRAEFRGWRERLWGWLLFDAGDFVMMRKMLRGIKERAEARSAKDRVNPREQALAPR